MKRFALPGILFSALLLMMNACASKDEVVTTKTGTVPGEKVYGEGVQPGIGASGPTAGVHW